MSNAKKYIDDSSVRINIINIIQKMNCPVSKEAPLVITFAGKFKTGKSSLINAILGYDLLPTKATTATAVVTKIRKGRELKAIFLKDNKSEVISPEKAKDIILHYQVTDLNNLPEIVFEVPVPWLSTQVEIRDTPGMDDSAQNGILEEVSMRSLQDTDVCICVYDASSLLSGNERERTEKIHKTLNGNVVYAVNCINRLNSYDGQVLVEKKAKSFFDTLSHSLPGMGTQYMISSAPGNLALNGFDEWFHFFASSKNDLSWQAYRSAAAIGQLKAMSETLLSENEQDLFALNTELVGVKEKHNSILQEKMKKARQKGKEASDYVKYTVGPEAEKIFVTTFGLESTLSDIYGNAEKMGKYSSYQSMCSDETVKFFEEKYREVCKKWDGVYDKKYISFIKTAISKINFPDKHRTSVSSTTGERLGGAAVGAGIGAMFGGPIGALIGGAIGRAVGGADSTVDDSVSNTANFIRNNVLPSMRSSFQKITSSIAQEHISDADKEAKACLSGLEKDIEELEDALNVLEGEKETLTYLMIQ